MRARDCGFDIVYVYGAHSYLPMQFLSGFYNKRTDAYGGSLEHRARFWLETLERVREAVGDDCAVVTRIAVDALGPAGIHVDEALAFVKLADDLVDLWDVNVGSIALWSKDSGTSRYFAEGYQFEWTGRIREATAKPIVGVARLTNPDLMASIVRSGTFDLIGGARPSIADPFLPQKIAEGRTDEIRECTGSNVCIMKVDGHGHLGCIQNPTAGEEHRRGWHPERFERAANADRGVLVVGAGPAGMECAVTLGKRGFEAVHLVEAESEIGGRMRWVRRLPTLGDWGRIVDWRQIQLDKLPNVAVVTGSRLDGRRRPRLRRADRDRRDRLALVGRRRAGRHARADRGRRPLAPPRDDAGAGRRGGQATSGALAWPSTTRRATSAARASRSCWRTRDSRPTW